MALLDVLSTLLQSVRRPFLRPERRAARKATFRPMLETLENREVPSVSSTLNNVLAQGDVVSLQANGRLTRTDTAGTTVLDDGAGSIAVGVDASGRQALYDLKTNGHLYAYGAGGFVLLDDGTGSIASGVNGFGRQALYDLKVNGQLYAYGTGGFVLLDKQTQTIASGVDAFGRQALYDLETNGYLYAYGTGGFVLLDNQAGSIAAGVDASGHQALYDLKNNDHLYVYDTRGFGLLDDGTGSITTGIDASGRQALYDLKVNGQLYAYGTGGFVLLDNQTQTVTTGIDGFGRQALYDLETNGYLYAYGTGGFVLLDNQSVGIAPQVGAGGQPSLLDVKTNGLLYGYDTNGFSLVADHRDIANGGASGPRSLLVPSFFQVPVESNLNYNNRVVAFAESMLGRQVGSGQCTDLAIQALQYAGAKTTYNYGVSGLEKDYIWGAGAYEDHLYFTNGLEVEDVTYTASKDQSGHYNRTPILAGDIIQFRDYTDSDGISAPHHTAIIKQVLGNGVYDVLEQNSNNQLYVTEATYNLSHLTQGTYWIYQPVALGAT